MSTREVERDQELSRYTLSLGMLTYLRYVKDFSAPYDTCFPVKFQNDYDDKTLLKNENALGINI
jgi:hypothetical protein